MKEVPSKHVITPTFKSACDQREVKVIEMRTLAPKLVFIWGDMIIIVYNSWQQNI
jgi:hypothetical protein